MQPLRNTRPRGLCGHPPMSSKAFLAWIVVLGAPTALLFGVLGDFGAAPSPGIGGGGYDLSGPVYTALLVALTGIWAVAALTVALMRRHATRWDLGLVAVGAAALLVALLLHGHQLPLW